MSATAVWAALTLVATAVVSAAGVPPATAAAGDIRTVAGGGVGDNGAATSARLHNPEGIAVDAAGNVYVADNQNNRIRRITPGGVITTVAGNGIAGFSGDGGPATAAALGGPQDVAVDSAGDIFIADPGNNRVRRVDHATGTITTVAGSGVNGDNGDNGPAVEAALLPTGIALDNAGNLFISDLNASRVRKVDLSTGVITAYAGQPTDPLCFLPPPISTTPCFSGDNGPAVNANLYQPVGLAVGPNGDLFIADSNNNRIRKVDHASGIITTVAGDGGGDPFTGGFGGDNGPAVNAQLSIPTGVWVPSNGDLYIVDQLNNRVRKVVPGADGVITGAADEIITSVAGNGNFGVDGDSGPATAAAIGQPYDVAVDSAGNMYITQPGEDLVRKVNAAGTVSTFAGGGIGDGGRATAAVLEQPWDVATAGGGFYVSENEADFNTPAGLGNRVRRIDASGTITTVAGTGEHGFSGDGGPATEAQLDGPRGLAVDGDGNLYIADCGNHRVRKVTASTGVITTFAGGGSPADGVGDSGQAAAAALDCPTGLFFTSTGPRAGTLLIADAGANRVRAVSPGGLITTVAGTGVAGMGGDDGQATAARLSGPQDAVVDAAGNVLIADTGNNRVRRVDSAGLITTVAGDGASGFGADNVPARISHVVAPGGLALDAAGNLLISESGFARVRKVDSAGVITTIAGNGIPGFTGDGGPAVRAQLDHPVGIDITAGGSLLIADKNNNRVREVLGGGAPPPPRSGCGQLVTRSRKLTRDIGPCAGDGIVIRGNGITLNLNGHRVIGNAARTGTHTGIRLEGTTAVTVKGGTVRGFDAGVAIVGGFGNTIANMAIRDNLGAADPAGSEYGDGIVTFFSAHNRITRNRVVHNGVFDGIAMLGQGSDGNVVLANTVTQTTADNTGGPAGIGILVNPFLSVDLPRNVSDFGNQILGNTVTGNDAAGISTLSNVDGVVADNVVSGNGFHAAPGNGIGVQHLQNAQPDTHELVQGNHVTGNAAEGIDLVADANLVRDNQVHGNGRSGIHSGNRFLGFLGGGPGLNNRITDNDASGNALAAPDPFDPSPPHDLVDEHPDCDANVWLGNIWGPAGFFPDCTSNGGHQAPPASAAAAAAAAPMAHTTAPVPRAQPAANQDPPPRRHPPKPA